MMAWRKLMVFAPQMVAGLLSTVSGMGAGLLQNHAVVMFPLVVIASVSGLVSAISAIIKMADIEGPGDWKRLMSPCRDCRELEAELETTRRALLELRP